jgi:predicted DNA-binding transcriptional regulator AlpA
MGLQSREVAALLKTSKTTMSALTNFCPSFPKSKRSGKHGAYSFDEKEINDWIANNNVKECITQAIRLKDADKASRKNSKKKESKNELAMSFISGSCAPIGFVPKRIYFGDRYEIKNL